MCCSAAACKEVKGTILSSVWVLGLWFLGKTRTKMNLKKQRLNYLIFIGNSIKNTFLEFFSTLGAWIEF